MISRASIASQLSGPTAGICDGIGMERVVTSMGISIIGYNVDMFLRLNTVVFTVLDVVVHCVVVVVIVVVVVAVVLAPLYCLDGGSS